MTEIQNRTGKSEKEGKSRPNDRLGFILVLVMKEHPVDGPIGLDREVA